MRNFTRPLATLSLVAAAGFGGAALAADAAAPAAPTGPSLADVLTASGITTTGYVDGTASYFTFSGTGAPKDYNSFTFQQAGLQVAYQPTSGFGGLLNVVAAPYSIYNYNYAPNLSGTTTVQVLQGFVQYVSGPLTLIGGKFATLAGAEVYAPTGNTNVTRSLLFSFEPVTHTGVRATWAVSDQFSFIAGVNNGWFNAGDEKAAGSDKTAELGISLTPNKIISWTLQGYYGRDTTFAGNTANLSLLDTVLTWNATSALSLVGSIDYGQQSNATGANTASAKWTGYAAYFNYAINDAWRVSVRGEYFDDHDGYLTGTAVGAKLKEGTVTFGYMPDKHFELRLEGRYDKSDASDVKTTQAWVEGLFKF
jgi:hypothetical protein